jgi:hypothetical protein
VTADVADVLDKAADLIDPAKGGRWIRGQTRDGLGGFCMIGALSRAAWERHLLYSDVVGTAAKAVEALLAPDPISSWNDQDCLDGHEAANVLRKAAEIERAS